MCWRILLIILTDYSDDGIKETKLRDFRFQTLWSPSPLNVLESSCIFVEIFKIFSKLFSALTATADSKISISINRQIRVKFQNI